MVQCRLSILKGLSSTRKLFTKFPSLICFLLLCLPALTACQKNKPVQTPLPASTTTSSAVTPPELTAGDTTFSMNYAGIERTYILHVPPNLPGTQKLPLVLAFHGLTLNANEMIRISGLNDQADTSGFLVVYPNGTGKNTSWNGGHCCGEAAKNNVDDIGFVRALVEELSTFMNIDPKRIFVTGFSNGAIFTYRVACDLSDIIAAVSPVSATQILEDMESCTPVRPVPLIHFHGTADEANPYEGGTSLAGLFVSVSDQIQFWARSNGCPAESQVTETGSIRHDLYTPCTAGADVELYTVVDGLHAWPGEEAVNQKMGEPTQEISASAIIWEFFASHPMP